jgi:hypothetical protein
VSKKNINISLIATQVMTTHVGIEPPTAVPTANIHMQSDPKLDE